MIALPAPSPRALTALQLAADGLTDTAIAYRMQVSVKMVRRDLDAAREWLDAGDRTSAAYRLGRIQGSRPSGRRRVRGDELTLGLVG